MAVIFIALAVACSSDGGSAHASDRGAGLRTASLPAAQAASAYAAALREAFDVGPGLALLIDPALLPRSRGSASTQRLAAGVVRGLRTRGVIQGNCQPRGGTKSLAPICPISTPGYVIRVSDIFEVARDTVQLYLTAERFRAARDSARFAPPLNMEQRYTLARRGPRWAVASKEQLVP
ncbi:MAG TPA: hypothetical protein VFW98_11300 [Gemmatimonadaceae bacterium]|nr:hypothetical protein [Gemmatimonadaceae bacterium]